MKIDSRTPMLPTQAARGAHSAAAMAKPEGAKPQSIPAPAAPAASTGMSPLERLAAFGNQLMERVDQAEKDAPVEERSAIANARTSLEEGLARLHHGISGGTMKPEDIQRGVTNMFEQTRMALDEARGRGGAKPEGPGETMAGAGGDAQPIEKAVTTSGLAARLADLQAEMTATLFQGLGDDSPAARRDTNAPRGAGPVYGALSGMQGQGRGAGSGLDLSV